MKPRISYARFSLPFLNDAPSKPEPDDEGDGRSRDTDLEYFEDQLPDDAIFLGSVDSSVGNWCEWKIDDHFYLLPWRTGPFKWALFRITWDDNWSRYDWSPDARIAGVPGSGEASRRLLRGVFRKWRIDLRKRDGEPYKDLLGR